MKKAFSEYYNLKEDEFKELWDNCLFVFDTNILLNLYRYSKKTRDAFFDILEIIQDRVWLPYQVGYEYHKERLGVIYQMQNVFDKATSTIESSLNQIKSELKTMQYPSWEDKENSRIINSIDDWQEKIIKIIELDKKNYPNLIENDLIRNNLNSFFDKKTGDNYSEEKLKDFYKEGKARYDNEIPPGYKDIKKTKENEKYGDLIIWKQIIDKTKESNKSIIFVTDDAKEDWWLITKSKTNGCRPELIKEFCKETGQCFYMYNSERFIKFAQSKFKGKIKINNNVIKEIQEVRENADIEAGQQQYLFELQDILGEDFAFECIQRPPKNNKYNLSDTELDILGLLVQGNSMAEISRKMSVPKITMARFISNILNKLNVKDRTEAALLTIKEELLKGYWNPQKFD